VVRKSQARVGRRIDLSRAAFSHTAFSRARRKSIFSCFACALHLLLFCFHRTDPVPPLLDDEVDASDWFAFVAALEQTDAAFTRRRNSWAVLPALLLGVGLVAALFLLLPGPQHDPAAAGLFVLLAGGVAGGAHALSLGDEQWARWLGFDAALEAFLAKWQGRLAPLQLTLHSFPASRRSNRAVWFCSLALPPKPLQVKRGAVYITLSMSPEGRELKGTLPHATRFYA
jgi:hypothetical protein